MGLKLFRIAAALGMAASLLTLLLAGLLFAVSRKMFGNIAALVSLTLFVFEPNILAHGALVTTDMAMSCFLFATVYAFYQYVKRPSSGRVVLVGITSGLALASKHSAVLVFPILLAIAVAELWVRKKNPATSATGARPGAAKLAGALVGAGVIAIALLWASYGFRLHPRAGVSAETSVMDYAQRLHHPA